MVPVLGTPVPTRGRYSLGYRYSQLFLTSRWRVREYRLVGLELRRLCSIIQSPPKRSGGLVVDGQRESGMRSKRREGEDRERERKCLEILLTPSKKCLTAMSRDGSLLYDFSIRSRPAAFSRERRLPAGAIEK